MYLFLFGIAVANRGLNHYTACFIASHGMQMEIILFGIAVANRGLNHYTACFIASHGMQMEIMMKTKQANNPKFLFRIKLFYSLFHSIPWNADGNNDEDKTSQHSEGLVHAL